MTERALFDPGDPFDAMSDQFRTQIVDMVIRAGRTTIYRELSPQRQLECFLSGALTGVVCVAFASIDEAGRDALMEYIRNCLPIASELAEGIMSNARR